MALDDRLIPESLGHFTLVEKLGEGGMGVVYKAVDQRLHRAVALKVLRAGVAADSAQRQRFLREARAAAAIVHGNVAAIYDVGEDAGRVFIAMELVPGVTLRALLDARTLTPGRAVAIVATVARALDKAHALGVVHRDLKPDNVMVTDDGVVKVVDFGVARLSDEHSVGADPRATGHLTTLAGATADGKIVGTPAYMAPEQARGEPTGPGTDIFALGVVLYEALTFVRPFHAATLEGLLHAIVFDSPPRVSAHMAFPDERLDAIVLRCLAKASSHRYASAGELATALEALGDLDRQRDGDGDGAEGNAAAASAPLTSTRAPSTPNGFMQARLAVTATLADDAAVASSTRTPSPRRRRILLAVVLACAALGALVAVQNVVARRRDAHAAKAPASTRRSVAVLGFASRETTPGAAWFGAALDELVTRELATSEDVRTSARDDVVARSRDLGLVATSPHSPDDLARLARALGADVLVSGVYAAVGTAPSRQLRLDLRAQLPDGTTVAHVEERGTESDVAGLALRAAKALREGLGLKAATAAETAIARASLPGDSVAAELYAEALARTAAFDTAGARAPLEALVARAPDFAQGHALFSDVLRTLRERKRAEEEAAKAFAASGPLGREEKLLIEARYWAAASKFEKARDIYRALYTFFPDDPRYGLALARAQISAGQSQDALATLDGMRRAPHADDQLAAIDRFEALAAMKMGDSRRALDAATRAAAEARARGMKSIEAYAHGEASEAARKLGDNGRASAEDAASEALFTEVGDATGVASRLRPRASRLLDEGDPDGARALLDRALVIATTLGNHYDAAGVLNMLGQVESSVGHLAAARVDYAASIEKWVEAGDKEGPFNVECNDAVVLFELGELAAAKRALEDGLAGLRALGMRNNAASTQVMLTPVLAAMGDFAAARTSIDDALREGAALAEHDIEADGKGALGALLYDRGELVAARAALTEAVASLDAGGEQVGRVDDVLGLASIARDEGRASDVDGLLASLVTAEGAAADASPSKARLTADSEARIRAFEACVMLARGDLPRAARAVERATALARATESAFVRLAVASARAEVAGDAEALDAIAAEASGPRLVLPRVALEARLARGYVLKRKGAPLGVPALEAVARDADARGFGALAARARGAARSAR